MGVNVLAELRRLLASYFAPKILSAKENNAKFVSYMTEDEYLNALQRRINRVLVRLSKLGYRMSYGADGIHIAWDHV